MVKMGEDANKEDFRDFNRREYEERRAEGQLTLAQRTCTALDDEMAGITVSDLFMSCTLMDVHLLCHHPSVQRSLDQP